MTVRKMMVIDGLGAFLTALLLSFVLIPLQPWVGMPIPKLELLTQLALFLGFYSFSIFFLFKNPKTLFLKIISFLNIGYCFLTLYLLLTHFEMIQWLGWSYFIGEIIVILLLVRWEWRTIKSNSFPNETHKN